jgi:flavin-dependent dehydrogenase
MPAVELSPVVIIGCGPAGASCALKLKKSAEAGGRQLPIIVYEGKRLDRKSYYNQCLGVLSPPLEDIMERELGVPFPWPIIQRRIDGYVVHADRTAITLEGGQAPSYACRRVEFDNYLYLKVKEAGIPIVPARVTDLDFSAEGVMVYSEMDNVKAGLVVGAFGLDDGMAKIFERATAYRMPPFLSSVVTKVHPGEGAMGRFGNRIHAFLPSSLRQVEFGAITPKGNHLSINIAGRRVHSGTLDDFLRLDEVCRALEGICGSELPALTYFKGKFPTLPARAPYGSRYVMIGDAAGLNRPFKGKGINSAVITGLRAAEAIVARGCSVEAFEEYLESCAELTQDIPYGRVLRALVNGCSRFGLMEGVLEAAGREPGLRRAMFNIVSGQETYRRTWRETRSVGLMGRILISAIRKKLARSPAA